MAEFQSILKYVPGWVARINLNLVTRLSTNAVFWSAMQIIYCVASSPLTIYRFYLTEVMKQWISLDLKYSRWRTTFLFYNSNLRSFIITQEHTSTSVCSICFIHEGQRWAGMQALTDGILHLGISEVLATWQFGSARNEEQSVLSVTRFVFINI
jgi:hypothetical protein